MVSPPPPDSVIFRTDWRQELVRLNDDSAARLLTAYQRTLPRIQQAAGELTAQLNALAGQELASISADDLRGLSSYQRLLARVEAEMRDFAVIIRNEAANAQDDGLQLGLDAAVDMVGSQAGPLEAQILAAFNRPDPAAIQRLIGYVDGAAMQERFAAFGESAAQNIADLLLTGVAQGKNPRAIAGLISNWYNLPYVWAENMTRTVQNWSYRTASHAAYAANPEIVTGWMWWASLDDRTCLSCWGQHGSTHDVREVLNDHHRGRCLTPGQLVTTQRGNIPIEQVCIGDMVLTHAGNWRRVASCFERDYSGDVLTIKVDGCSVTVTPEHPVWTQRGWIEARSLSASDTFLTLVSSEVRGSSLKTNQPHSVNFWSRVRSVGRFLGERCQRASHSTASISLGNAKSILYASTAICGTGLSPFECSTSKKRLSSSDIWLKVCCLMSAVFNRASRFCPPSMNGFKKSGLFFNWRETASCGLIGVIPHSRISLMSGRVLMPSSAVISRYDACSVTYRRVKYEQIGSPMRASKSAFQRLLWSLPVVSGSIFGKPNTSRRWWIALSVRPSRSAISFALRTARFARMKLSSLADHFLPAIFSLHSNETIIQQSQYGGKVYDLEIETDHSFFAGGIAVHNCTPLPIVRGTRWADNVQRGQDRFNELDAEQQRRIMGNAMHRAWQSGAVQWGEFSKQYSDGVYGTMLREASLKDILGDDARRYYSHS